MSIKTKQFWLQVQNEVNKQYDYLCFSSPSFAGQWRSIPKKVNLRKLGRQFLKSTKQNPAFVISDDSCILFNTITGNFNGNTWTKWDFYQLRLDFVQWCVDKFD